MSASAGSIYTENLACTAAAAYTSVGYKLQPVQLEMLPSDAFLTASFWRGTLYPVSEQRELMKRGEKGKRI